MKAMLEKAANEQEARTHAEKQAQGKNVKVASDMSEVKPSELWNMAVADRVRGVLQSGSISKGTGKGKGETKPFYPQELYTLHQDRSGRLMSKKRQVASGSWGERKHVQSCRPGKDSIRGKGKSKQITSPKGKSRGKKSGEGKQSKHQSFTAKARANTRSLSQM